MGWFDTNIGRVARDWRARRLQGVRQRQPHIQDVQVPHGAGYWSWVVADALAYALVTLLAGALFVLPFVLVQRSDRIGSARYAVALCGLLAGIGVLVWISVCLKERRVAQLVVSVTGEIVLLAVILIATM